MAPPCGALGASVVYLYRHHSIKREMSTNSDSLAFKPKYKLGASACTRQPQFLTSDLNVQHIAFQLSLAPDVATAFERCTVKREAKGIDLTGAQRRHRVMASDYAEPAYRGPTVRGGKHGWWHYSEWAYANAALFSD